MPNELDTKISKSLEDIDSLVNTLGLTDSKEDVTKALPNEEDDVTPDDVSDDIPDDGGDNPDVDEDADDQDDVPPEDTDEDVAEKSLEAELKSGDNVKKALEVSEFLDTLVKGISTRLESHTEALQKSIETNSLNSDTLSKSLQILGGVVKSQRVVLEAQQDLSKSIRNISKRLKSLEEQPTVRKSVQSKVEIKDRNFGAPLGGAGQEGDVKLSKSQISSKLTDEVLIKGNMDFKQDLLAFEGTGGNINSLSENAKKFLGIDSK